MRVALVCFANTCRSPVAEAFLHHFLASESNVELFSRGVAGGPGVTPPAMAEALESRGLSLVSPSGERFGSGDLDADLYLFMERPVLREAVVANPVLWSRSFTMREFARRAQLNPPEPGSETFAEWVGVLHATRKREDLMSIDRSDDVLDPGLGGDVEAFQAMIRDIELLSAKVAVFLSGWPAR